MPFQNQSPHAPPVKPAPIRVLVVDDSAFMRFSISKRLNESPEIDVVGAARDGQEALEMLVGLDPDVITLDVEMPRLDGLATLRHIMAHHPLPVIMLSSLTSEGARETIQALTWGAVDFIAKPVAKANIDSIMEEVITKIRRAARARVFPMPLLQSSDATPKITPPAKITRSLTDNDKVVVIGSSTGGPRALNAVLAALPEDLPAAFLFVQHMPNGFTRSLAERLDGQTWLAIKEASQGDALEAGRGLVAPGGFHMLIDDERRVTINQNPPVHGVRPSVDVTMNSAAQHFGPSVVGVVLTGMGSDGTHGATIIQGNGGYVIAEDESSCVVWGMPRSVVEAGAADEVQPIAEIATAIAKAVRRRVAV